jgi:hypothetical protein
MNALGRAFDVRHPVFRPLWARVAVVALILVWTGFEFTRGATLWGLFFGAAGLYLGYRFFVVFDPKDYERKDDVNG